MKAAREFLQALSQAVTSRRLYREEHPAIGRADESAYARLRDLLEENGRPVFSFVGDRVILGDRPLPDLEGWPRGPALADAGMGRLEFLPGVTEEELVDFIQFAAGRLHAARETRDGEADAEAGEPGADEPRTEERDGESPTFPHILYGPVQIDVREARDRRGPGVGAGVMELLEEAETNRWLHETAREEGRVGADEAQAVVRSLSVALHSGKHPAVPLEQLSGLDQYTTVHSMNVTLLSMALAEEAAYGSEDVFELGVGALLHDIGKTQTPLEILNKPGKLTDDEFATIQRHPADGAAMLLESSPDLRLAAVIAYEHHMQGGSGGYPARRYERERHPASRLVQVCDVYDSLRTDRPYRDAMPPEKARGILRKNAESGAFDPEMTETFLEMIDRVELRIETDGNGAGGNGGSGKGDGTGDGGNGAG